MGRGEPGPTRRLTEEVAESDAELFEISVLLPESRDEGRDLRHLQMRERRLEQVCRVLGDERRVGRCGRVERDLDVALLDELEEAGEHECRRLEARLVVGIGQNEEHVLQEREVVRLEEAVRGRRTCADNVVDQLDADHQAEVADVAHGVLRRPDDRVHDELELLRRELEQRVEAVEVDDSQQLEEGDAVSIG